MNTPEKIYIVRRDFKAGGKVFAAGSIVEDPSEIHLFKTRLADRHIIEVPPPTDKKALLDLANFLKVRYNVDLGKVLKERVSKGSSTPAPVKPVAEAPTTNPGTPVTVEKPSVKVEAPQVKVLPPENK